MTSIITIFDLGRTHKKILLFDQDYKVAEERAVCVPDIKDEDGYPCEDLQAISKWMKEELNNVLKNKNYDVRAINFSTHGASLVHIDKRGLPVTPLYDYMRPLDENISNEFYSLFGGKFKFSVATASPAINMLNSGIQLYWLKKAKPDYFKNIASSLHLPQYANYLFSHKRHADITSIGCHTGLWDFKNQSYHQWLQNEKITHQLPVAEPVHTFDIVDFEGKKIPVGIGLHDSSAALLPFVKTTTKPFVLLSTGTWNISLNPFFEGTLDEDKYLKDCLYYLLGIGEKVAASRLFLGNELEHQVKRLEVYFNKQKGYYYNIILNKEHIEDTLKTYSGEVVFYPDTMKGTGPFPDLAGASPDLSKFKTFEAAYYKMMLDLTYLQKQSIELISGDIKRLYISGGFLKNVVFLEILQGFLPDWKLFIAENKRASPLGAAIALHGVWQDSPLPDTISGVIPYERKFDLDLSEYAGYVGNQ